MSDNFNLDMVDIEKHIEYSLTLGLRACFQFDDIYKYNDDDLETEIIITPDYPEKSSTNKKPYIIITGITYNISDNSLNKNYFSDIISNGEHTGTQYLNLVSFSATIMCFTVHSGTCKDLTNRALNYILFGKSEIFNDEFSLNINRINKSPVSIQGSSPDNTYFCAISLGGSLDWVGVKNYNTNIIKSIKQVIQIKQNQK